MSGWAHAVGSHVARRGAERPGPGAACWVPMMGSGSYSACGCLSPTPDPASPCGMVRSGYMTPCDADPVTRDAEGWEQASYERKAHRYLPTRCTCGHAIEAVR